MTHWPPDGLWRITVPSGSSIPVTFSGGVIGSYVQPVPASGSPVLANTSGPISANGNSPVWTPTIGKRFCLLAWAITISGNAARASGSATPIQLRDGATTPLADYSVFLPGTAGTVTGSDIFLANPNLGAPIASAAVNNVLNLNLGSSLTAGSIRVVAWGFETA